MKENIIRYDVYDKKNRWAGSYSTALCNPNHPTALEMARMNWKQSLGKIVAIHGSGLEIEIANFQAINK